MLESLRATTHYVANQIVEVEGDVAWAESYCLAHHVADPAVHGRPEWVIHVRYCDRFERREGEWRIARRICAYEPDTIDATTKQPLAIDRIRSTRNRSDPAYLRD